MQIFSNLLQTASDAWQVLLLFVIPIGGGIPAGVVLANSKGFGWPLMMFIYIISDLILAVVFEPLMHTLRKSQFFLKLNQTFKNQLRNSILKNSISSPGPMTLIAISFGVDPMTGRVATYLAGHSFLSGWTLTIIGDMFFFTLVMASTLWLNNILGDGMLTAVIITILMIGIPMLIKKIRGESTIQN